MARWGGTPGPYSPPVATRAVGQPYQSGPRRGTSGTAAPPTRAGRPPGPAQAGAVHGCEPGVQHAGGPAEPAVAVDRRGAIPDDPSRPVGNGRGKGAGY